jgi:hypothetical protein
VAFAITWVKPTRTATGRQRGLSLPACQHQRRRTSMPLAIEWFVWGGLLGLLYLIAFITAGVMTIRNGHIVMFIIGFIFPILWIIGAFMDKPRY